MNGIQCEWELYDDNGTNIETISSEMHVHVESNDNPIKSLLEIPFGFNLFGPVLVHSDDLLNGFELTSNINVSISMVKNHQFGGNGGTLHEELLSIPKDHVVIGFHGGFGAHLHNLGIITIPYKKCVDYDLKNT
eukprot:UN10798